MIPVSIPDQIMYENLKQTDVLKIYSPSSGQNLERKKTLDGHQKNRRKAEFNVARYGKSYICHTL